MLRLLGVGLTLNITNDKFSYSKNHCTYIISVKVKSQPSDTLFSSDAFQVPDNRRKGVTPTFSFLCAGHVITVNIL